MNKEFIKYKLNNNENRKYIKLYLNKEVFRPTETTKFLLEAVIKKFPKRKVTVLDLGCGNGVVGIYLLKKYKNIINMTFADISEKAIINARQNCELNKISKRKTQFLKSSVFENIKDSKFDIIINDISGISYEIAKISEWFRNVPCESGDDGTKLTLNVLKNFKFYLKPKGFIFFPIISLSNEKKIQKYLQKIQAKSTIISVNEWPIPNKMYKHTLLLKKLKNLKKISYEKKFNLIIANTKIIYTKLS